jgi:hypothetical protein
VKGCADARALSQALCHPGEGRDHHCLAEQQLSRSPLEIPAFANGMTVRRHIRSPHVVVPESQLA